MINVPSPDNEQPRPRGIRLVQSMDDVLPVENFGYSEVFFSKRRPIGSIGNAELGLEQSKHRYAGPDRLAYTLSADGNKLTTLLHSTGTANGLASFFVNFMTNASLPPNRTVKLTLHIDGIDNPLTSTAIKDDEGTSGRTIPNLMFDRWKIEESNEEMSLLIPFSPEFFARTAIQLETIDGNQGGDVQT